MGIEHTISQRLKQIANYLSKGTTFADIGSDHALLPTYVCMNDPKSLAIAGEVNKGPYSRAVETVKTYHLMKQIDVRLGDGLDVVNKDEVNELVLAGMGGTLMASILEKGKDKLGSIEKLIIQPNTNEREIRRWIDHGGFKITNEEIIKEHGHFYEIIVANRWQEGSLSINSKDVLNEEREKQWMFGPLLLENKTAIFAEKWQEEKVKYERILKQMNQAYHKSASKVARLEKELTWIEEVLGWRKN